MHCLRGHHRVVVVCLCLAGCQGAEPLGDGPVAAAPDRGRAAEAGADLVGVDSRHPDVPAPDRLVEPPLPKVALDCSKNPGLLLHPLFGDQMVLQREAWVPVWGCTAPATPVTVSIGGQSVTATADAQGLWVAQLRPLPAGGPLSLSVVGVKSQTLQVMIGDVWLCSGQSNMAMPVSSALNADAEIADADKHPELRLFTVPRWGSPTPTQVFAGGSAAWEAASKSNVGSFSATCYFFARELSKTAKVPLGLIDSSVGGTKIEWWMSAGALATDPDLAKNLPVAAKATPGATSTSTSNVTLLYNGMIAPLTPFALRGVVWYQGESNASLPAQYQRLLPGLIQDWRARFDLPQAAFLVVQLPRYQAVQQAPSEGGWAGLREAQLLTYLGTPGVGLAVTIDTGEATNIHPVAKQDVGARLAVVAGSLVYKQPGPASGPIYKSHKVQGGKIVLSFDQVGAGLMVGSKTPLQPVTPLPGGALAGFAVAGSNKTFVWATATITGSTVVVSAPTVSAPVAVRYGWASNPPCNLYSKEGLPASPFRTDSW